VKCGAVLVQEAFEKVLGDLRVELFHDIVEQESGPE